MSVPFVGAFAVAAGIIAWVAGNILRGSARFAVSGVGSFPMMTPPPVAAVAGCSCPKCGNQNQVAVSVCSVCGTAQP